jgi:hypothetical protein
VATMSLAGLTATAWMPQEPQTVSMTEWRRGGTGGSSTERSVPAAVSHCSTKYGTHDHLQYRRKID